MTYSVYGALYTWTAATAGEGASSISPSGIQGICPDGWHVPSNLEWYRLFMSLGLDFAGVYDEGWTGTNQGSQLAGSKEGWELWKEGSLKNDPQFGSSGFTGLPGGFREITGYFESHYEYGIWWTTTEYDGKDIVNREDDAGSIFRTVSLNYSRAQVNRYRHMRSTGLYVRCVREVPDIVKVTDYEGNVYNTIKIGDKRWMAQNS